MSSLIPSTLMSSLIPSTILHVLALRQNYTFGMIAGMIPPIAVPANAITIREKASNRCLFSEVPLLKQSRKTKSRIPTKPPIVFGMPKDNTRKKIGRSKHELIELRVEAILQII